MSGKKIADIEQTASAILPYSTPHRCLNEGSLFCHPDLMEMTQHYGLTTNEAPAAVCQCLRCRPSGGQGGPDLISMITYGPSLSQLSPIQYGQSL